MEVWKFALAVVTTVLGAGWTAFVYFDRRKNSSKGQQVGPVSVTVRQSAIVPAFIMVLGLAIVAWAVKTGMPGSSARGEASINQPTDIAVQNGVYVGRDAIGNDVKIDGEKQR